MDAAWYSLVAILVTGYGLKKILIERKSAIQKIIGVILILIGLSLIYSFLTSNWHGVFYFWKIIFVIIIFS